MKRGTYFYLIVALLVLCFLVCGSPSAVMAYPKENLYGFVSSKNNVKIHIGDFTVSEKVQDITVEGVTAAIKAGLENRKSVNFTVVDTIEDADLSISGELINFIYSEHDPVEAVPPFRLPIDLVMDQAYARLDYEITVLDAKKNRRLWKKFLKATVTESDMTREEGVSVAADRAAYVFIKECFGRQKKR